MPYKTTILTALRQIPFWFGVGALLGVAWALTIGTQPPWWAMVLVFGAIFATADVVNERRKTRKQGSR